MVERVRGAIVSDTNFHRHEGYLSRGGHPPNPFPTRVFRSIRQQKVEPYNGNRHS